MTADGGVEKGMALYWKRAVRAHSPVLVCSACEDVWWPDQNLEELDRQLAITQNERRSSDA